MCGASLHDRKITFVSYWLAVTLITYVVVGDPGLDFPSHSDVDSHIDENARLGLMIQ